MDVPKLREYGYGQSKGIRYYDPQQSECLEYFSVNNTSIMVLYFIEKAKTVFMKKKVVKNYHQQCKYLQTK